MKEIFTMWKHTKMIVLTALTGAIYAAVLMPFKIFAIIPGFTEVRPGVVVPIVFGILFGPAGAWGSAMGNFIGDFMGGMFSIASIFGAIGNFFFALTSYKLWGLFTKENEELVLKENNKIKVFIFISILSSSTCAMLIAWGLEILKILPFAAFASVVFINNLICPIILSPFLFWLLYPRVKKFDLFWTDIMSKEEVSPHWSPRIGGILMWLGGLGGLIIGILVSTGVYNAELLNFAVGAKGPMVVWSVSPFVISLIAGCILI
ncbi:MAG: QueT transporter family protein [Candidatus Firestonebacteria bacterium]|nr:QueT transporter family protein [Candidatus Firestonebacteria bacterium]